MLQELKRENFDQTVKQGDPMIIFFYKETNAESVLTMTSIKEVNQMIGRNFQIYLVNADLEPEICNACNVRHIPEIISIINTKIFKRAVGVLKSNEILSLLKK